MGHWSAEHWKTAVFGWLAFVVAAFLLGGAVGTVFVDPNSAGPGESGRMDRILDAGFKQPAHENVLVQSESLRVDDAAFTAAIEDVLARVSAIAVVQNVRSPLDESNSGQVSGDERAALVEFDIRGDAVDAADKVEPVVDAVAAAQAAHPGFFIGAFGDASASHAADTLFAEDLGRAGVYSIPITLIILVVAFGSLVAAGIPLLLALTAVIATFGLAAVASHVVPLAEEAFAVVLLIGLAVGVDYSMFYLKRERQERAAGRTERGALEAAAATSGRSVLVSGLTVMVAMAGLFLTGDVTFASFGYATIIVVAVAMLGSLTVLPALLSRLGDNVDRLRVPFVSRLRRDDGEGRIWGAVVNRVLRRPLVSALLAGGLLVALALPALQVRLATPRPEAQFPKSLDIVKTYERMQEAFPGTALPATVVVEAADVNGPAVQDAIRQLEQRALESGQMGEAITVEVNDTQTVASITVPIAGTGTDPASNTALAELRDEVVPETVGALPGVEAGVTGLTATWKDQGDQMESWLAPVVGFVLVFAFAVMLVAFRSLVIAAKSILLNLLSVAAAYGVLVLVFQHGYGKGVLGFAETAGIEPVVPLLLFVILFGLSMDYHVFILSRIRETFDRGASIDEAVAHGIKSTAGVVTSAAIVMVAVFSVFGALSIMFFKQFGVGLAAAVLIDATIVRAVLLPATMKLLGDWNWYLPPWLQWLPRFEHGEPPPDSPPTPASM
jgi:RND superfamily putative drug exporter